MKKLKQFLITIFGGWIKEPTKVAQAKQLLRRIIDNDKSMIVLSVIANQDSGETTIAVAGNLQNIVQAVMTMMDNDEVIKGALTEAVLKHHLEHHIADQAVDSLFNEMGFKKE